MSAGRLLAVTLTKASSNSFVLIPTGTFSTIFLYLVALRYNNYASSKVINAGTILNNTRKCINSLNCILAEFPLKCVKI